MNEKEKQIVASLEKIVPTMSESEKDYMAGFFDGMSAAKIAKSDDANEPAETQQ